MSVLSSCSAVILLLLQLIPLLAVANSIRGIKQEAYRYINKRTIGAVGKGGCNAPPIGSRASPIFHSISSTIITPITTTISNIFISTFVTPPSCSPAHFKEENAKKKSPNVREYTLPPTFMMCVPTRLSKVL